MWLRPSVVAATNSHARRSSVITRRRRASGRLRHNDAPRVVKGSFWFLWLGSSAGVAAQLGWAMGGKLLVGQRSLVDEIVERVAAGRQIVIRTSPWAVSRFLGQTRRQDVPASRRRR